MLPFTKISAINNKVQHSYSKITILQSVLFEDASIPDSELIAGNDTLFLPPEIDPHNVCWLENGVNGWWWQQKLECKNDSFEQTERRVSPQDVLCELFSFTLIKRMQVVFPSQPSPPCSPPHTSAWRVCLPHHHQLSTIR